ncbi:hypothetical protein [Stenoxybacter acetivorans]|nr:hypothetical protein [Stenoxybacter acetivorans]
MHCRLAYALWADVCYSDFGYAQTHIVATNGTAPNSWSSCLGFVN